MAVNFNSVQGLRDAVLEDTGVGASLPAYTVATDIVKGRMVRVLPPNSPARPSSSDSCARRPTSPFLKSNDSHAGSSNSGDATWSFRPPELRPPKNHEGPASRMETGPCSCPGCCIHPFWARRP